MCFAKRYCISVIKESSKLSSHTFQNAEQIVQLVTSFKSLLIPEKPIRVGNRCLRARVSSAEQHNSPRRHCRNKKTILLRTFVIANSAGIALSGIQFEWLSRSRPELGSSPQPQCMCRSCGVSDGLPLLWRLALVLIKNQDHPLFPPHTTEETRPRQEIQSNKLQE